MSPKLPGKNWGKVKIHSKTNAHGKRRDLSRYQYFPGNSIERTAYPMFPRWRRPARAKRFLLIRTAISSYLSSSRTHSNCPESLFVVEFSAVPFRCCCCCCASAAFSNCCEPFCCWLSAIPDERDTSAYKKILILTRLNIC